MGARSDYLNLSRHLCRAIDKDGKTPSTRVAEIAGCPLDPYPELLNCLRTIPAHNLTEAQRAYWVKAK